MQQIHHIYVELLAREEHACTNNPNVALVARANHYTLQRLKITRCAYVFIRTEERS